MLKNKRIIIAAGGTGGHIFPAQALAESLIEQGCHVILVCDDRANPFLQGAFKSIEKFYITSEKHTSSKLRKFMYYTKLFLSVFKVRSYLRAKKPDLVIGFGGYPSFPTLAAALTLNIKIAVHEQNAVLGVVNRMFAKFVDKIFISFSPTMKLKAKYESKAVLAGNMVRANIKKKKKKLDKKIRVLVIGGSQGAQVMTDYVPDALLLLPKELQKQMLVYIQARGNLVSETKEKFDKFLGKAQISEFFNDIGELMSNADIVICRAGAATISEITFFGKASIFIPYPHAVDNHQYYNALSLVDRGAATMIVQEELSSQNLAEKIQKILSNKEYRKGMEHNAHSMFDKDLQRKFIESITSIVS